MKTFFICLMSTFALSAFAGPQGSGGGKGVVCHDASGNVQSVELLDLWEAREVYGRPAMISNAPVADQVKNGIEALKYSIQTKVGPVLEPGDADHFLTEPELLARGLTANAQLFMSNSNEIHHVRGQKLTPTDDSFENMQPTGNCDIEQLVDYLDSLTEPIILVNQDLLDHMNNTNLAALYLHEGYYRYLRGNNYLYLSYRETNSVRTRRAIGYVFAGNKFGSLEALIGKDYVHCEGRDKSYSNQSEVYFYGEKDGVYQFIEAQIFGQPMIGFFPDPLNYYIGLDEILVGGACPYPNAPIGWGDGDGRSFYGRGPVDFQSVSWFANYCWDKKWTNFLQQDAASPFPRADVAQQMTCKVVHKK